jgi:hypothetical protein
MHWYALKGNKKALDLGYTLTLQTANNLSVLYILYADQGRLKEAEEMY